ncbi:MAG: ATP-binding cassette domain-containing protein [Gammaproteobacteria bacterium]|nr:ATP-binding cassette domain-containing protein [Gammaproteobacteria bacterium]
MSAPIKLHFQILQEGLNLRVDEQLSGQGITIIYGAPGSGKSTLLKCIAGVIAVPDAFLEVGEQVWHDSEAAIWLAPQDRAVGYIPEGYALFPHLTVEDNLYFAWELALDRDHESPAAGAEETTLALTLDAVSDLLGLNDLYSRYPHELTRVDSLRVALGRALLRQPQLLLLDEPLTGLDQADNDAAIELLSYLCHSLTLPLIITSSQSEGWTLLGDYLIYLKNGAVQESAPLHAILSRLDLPLAQSIDGTTLIGVQPGVVIEAEVFEHDEDFDLTRLFFDGGELTVLRIDRQRGEWVRLRMLADAVSIAIKYPSPSSFLNTIAATVDTFRPLVRGEMLVRLLLGGTTPILARLSEKSCTRLAIKPGLRVYVQVKCIALRVPPAYPPLQNL